MTEFNKLIFKTRNDQDALYRKISSEALFINCSERSLSVSEITEELLYNQQYYKRIPGKDGKGYRERGCDSRPCACTGGCKNLIEWTVLDDIDVEAYERKKKLITEALAGMLVNYLIDNNIAKESNILKLFKIF